MNIIRETSINRTSSLTTETNPSTHSFQQLNHHHTLQLFNTFATRFPIFQSHIKMHFKTFFVALGLVAATNAAALPAAEPIVEERAVSAPFKLRRFSPTAGPANAPTAWNGNEYLGINADSKYLFKTSREAAELFTYDPATFTLRATSTNYAGLVPRNQQSYDITVTPVSFAQSAGEPVKATIGPGPLFEVTLQTVRTNPVALWVSSTTVGNNVFLGKTADITPAQILRFRAEGYVPPV
jgi:hypothetical protein